VVGACSVAAQRQRFVALGWDVADAADMLDERAGPCDMRAPKLAHTQIRARTHSRTHA
jgi:hypothetical protein